VGISSVVRPRPAGEDFPAAADMWDFFFLDQVPMGDTYSLEGEDVDGTVLVQEWFSNSYDYVFAKGQRPRIYLGVVLDLSACDGSCWFDDPSLVYHSAGGVEGLAFRFDRL
jgi:hypothetical protein